MVAAIELWARFSSSPRGTVETTWLALHDPSNLYLAFQEDEIQAVIQFCCAALLPVTFSAFSMFYSSRSKFTHCHRTRWLQSISPPGCSLQPQAHCYCCSYSLDLDSQEFPHLRFASPAPNLHALATQYHMPLRRLSKYTTQSNMPPMRLLECPKFCNMPLMRRSE